MWKSYVNKHAKVMKKVNLACKYVNKIRIGHKELKHINKTCPPSLSCKDCSHLSIKNCLLILSHCRRLLTPLQRTNFENIVAKGNNGHNNPFFLFTQCFQLYSLVKHVCLDCRFIRVWMFSKLFAAYF